MVGARYFFKLSFTFIEWIIRGIPGGIGQRIRYFYYKRRFAECGGNVRIEEWVIFQNPENISIGDDVWIFAHSILTAPGPKDDKISKNKTVINAVNNGPQQVRPILKIGSEVQIGAFNILNGIGGLEIGNCVTLSARVSIYSATHLSNNPDDRSMRVGANGMVRSMPVFSKASHVKIGDGAWLGLGAIIICASVGDDTFVQSGAIVSRDLPDNVVYTGDPTKPAKERYFKTEASSGRKL